MTQFLPPNLLALFAARDAIPYKPPTAALSWEKDRGKSPYCGVAQFMSEFEDPKDTPPPTRGETKAEKKVRRIKEKSIIRAKEIEEEVKKYDPHNDKNATGDAFKTLFVGRINYDTSESKLRREFDMYGPIRKINMVKDLNGKPKGYAFIEFEHERDMHTAYKNADGRKIDGRRVLVDVERGRTVKGWRPLRLGGGLGATRRGANPDNIRQSGRQDTGTGTARPKEEDRVRDYGRGGSRDRKERRSSRDREKRDRGDRKDRRDRDRDRERSGRDRDDSGKERPRDRDRKHKNRDRSRERDRDSRRKRSRERDRDRERSGRDRSDKDRDRKGRSDRDRERPKEDVPPRSESKPEEYPQPPPKQDYNDQEMDQPGSGNENYNKHSYAEESGEYQGEMKQERKYDDYNDQNGDRNNDYQEKQSKNHEEQQAYLPEGAMEY